MTQRSELADRIAARAELGGLAQRGLVAGLGPSDAELLHTLGIGLVTIRRATEQAFGHEARLGRCLGGSAWTWMSTLGPCWRSLGWVYPRRARRGELVDGRFRVGGGTVFGRFTGPARRVLDLAREEAERAGHRYLGPEHVMFGLLAEGRSGAAWALRVRGVDLTAAWAVLVRLGNRGVVPAPRPSDARLLGSLGIDRDVVRYQTEQRFGVPAVGEATWRVTRRRWWRGARVVWTPLCGPPLMAKRAVPLASEQAQALGRGEVGPEHLLLGVCAAARQPVDMVRGSRRHRQIIAPVGLPGGYRGAAGPLLAVLGVELDRLVAVVTAELGGVQR